MIIEWHLNDDCCKKCSAYAVTGVALLSPLSCMRFPRCRNENQSQSCEKIQFHLLTACIPSLGCVIDGLRMRYAELKEVMERANNKNREEYEYPSALRRLTNSLASGVFTVKTIKYFI